MSIYRPFVLPDELDLSYLGRIMRINRFQTVKEAVSAMAGSVGLAHLSRRELSCLELLSLTSGMSLEAFAQKHSTIPLRRAITSAMPNLPHGSPTRRSLLYNFGMVAVRTGAYFCATCAHKDLSKHGCGYWRRSHQVPGQFWCQEHLTPLNYVENNDAFLSCTSSYQEGALAVPRDWAETASNNEFVLRYIDVVLGLIKRELPLDVKTVARALKKQATALGLNTVAAPVKNKLLLSDRIKDCFPSNWLANVVPSIVGKEAGKILNRVDGVLYMATSASSVWSYILAATVLYESAEDALKGLVSAQVDFAEMPRTRNCKQYVELDSNALSATYVECNGHHTLVAERLGLPLYRTRAVLRAAGLPDLTGDTSKVKNYKAASVAFHIQEKSFDESARVGGLTASEMSSLLRCSGVNFKTTLVAMAGTRRVRGTGIKRTKGFMPQEAQVLFG